MDVAANAARVRYCLPERAIGIAAHDFAQAMGAPEVALTRAARSEGVPDGAVALASAPRYGIAGGRVSHGALGADDTVQASRGTDRSGDIPAAPPARAAPVLLAARPRKLSVTQIETWLRDPYAVYARHILGLKALDELDADPGRAELGMVIHRTLEVPPPLPQGCLKCRGGVAAYRPRAIRTHPVAARRLGFLVAAVHRGSPAGWSLRNASGASALSRASASVRGAGHWNRRGGPFTITAKADRIDRLAEGGFLAGRLQDRRLYRRQNGPDGVCAATAARGRDSAQRRLQGRRRFTGGARILAADRRRTCRRTLPDRRGRPRRADRSRGRSRRGADRPVRRSGDTLSRGAVAALGAPLFRLPAPRAARRERGRGVRSFADPGSSAAPGSQPAGIRLGLRFGGDRQDAGAYRPLALADARRDRSRAHLCA